VIRKVDGGTFLIPAGAQKWGVQGKKTRASEKEKTDGMTGAAAGTKKDGGKHE